MEKQFIFGLKNFKIGDQAGGIKLVYTVKEVECLKIFNVHIPVKTLRKQEVVFLKPLKSIWGKTNNKKDYLYLSQNFRGKPKDPFLCLWIILTRDYKDFRKEFQIIRIKNLCKEKEYHKMIDFLNKRAKFFVLNHSLFLMNSLF